MEIHSPFDQLLNDMPRTLAADEAFVRELKTYAYPVSVKKGELLLRPGELCQNAYFINKGLFINIFTTEQGKECVTGFASDSQYPFLSEISYFTGTPSNFEIKAIEDGELLCISRVHIESLSARYSLFASYYQQAMLVIIAKLYMMFAYLQSYTAEEFIKFLYAHYKWIIQRVPDKYIALYMGISTSWYCKLKRKIIRNHT